MPSKLSELGFTEADIDTMVEKFHAHNGNPVTGVYYTMTPEVVKSIYKIAL